MVYNESVVTEFDEAWESLSLEYCPVLKQKECEEVQAAWEVMRDSDYKPCLPESLPCGITGRI